MQLGNWAPEHSQALRDHLARGMSFSEIAKAINVRFGTNYTRNAVIGRSQRMGLGGAGRQEQRPEQRFKATLPRKPRSGKRPDPKAPASEPPSPPPVRAEAVRLRCVGISPRLVSLIELGPGDCRYPYGGDRDGEPIVFCGHPQRDGSSYCTAHFHLTRGLGTASERAAGPVLLRLVEAA